jgi:hypothetical protein
LRIAVLASIAEGIVYVVEKIVKGLQGLQYSPSLFLLAFSYSAGNALTPGPLQPLQEGLPPHPLAPMPQARSSWSARFAKCAAARSHRPSAVSPGPTAQSGLQFGLSFLAWSQSDTGCPRHSGQNGRLPSKVFVKLSTTLSPSMCDH